MKIIKVDGKNYIRVGDKLIEVDENGRPTKACWSEEIKHPDGRVDCTVHVPCMQIAIASQKPM